MRTRVDVSEAHQDIQTTLTAHSNRDATPPSNRRSEGGLNLIANWEMAKVNLVDSKGLLNPFPN